MWNTCSTVWLWDEMRKSAHRRSRTPPASARPIGTSVFAVTSGTCRLVRACPGKRRTIEVGGRSRERAIGIAGNFQACAGPGSIIGRTPLSCMSAPRWRAGAPPHRDYVGLTAASARRSWSEAANRLQVDQFHVRRLIQSGRLPARQACKDVPWIIAENANTAPDIQAFLLQKGASLRDPRQQDFEFPSQ